MRKKLTPEEEQKILREKLCVIEPPTKEEKKELENKLAKVKSSGFSKTKEYKKAAEEYHALFKHKK